LEAGLRDPVVLPPPPRLRLLPPGLDETRPLQSMQDGVEHPVRPLQLAAGQLAYPLQDRVAVAVSLGQDGQNERRRRRRDEVLVDVHRIGDLLPPGTGFRQGWATRPG